MVLGSRRFDLFKLFIDLMMRDFQLVDHVPYDLLNFSFGACFKLLKL